MFEIVLFVHNLFRWLVLIFGLVAVLMALFGWLGRREWTGASRLPGVFFAISLDIQLLVGIILYFFLSPVTMAALRNFGNAMGDPQLRFFALEHVLLMLVALILAHLGNVIVRRAEQNMMKYRWAFIWYTVTLLIVIFAIPWWRPLIPGLS